MFSKIAKIYKPTLSKHINPVLWGGAEKMVSGFPDPLIISGFPVLSFGFRVSGAIPHRIGEKTDMNKRV